MSSYWSLVINTSLLYNAHHKNSCSHQLLCQALVEIRTVKYHSLGQVCSLLEFSLLQWDPLQREV